MLTRAFTCDLNRLDAFYMYARSYKFQLDILRGELYFNQLLDLSTTENEHVQ